MLKCSPKIGPYFKVEDGPILGEHFIRQALSIGAKVSKGQLIRSGPVEYGDYANSGKSHLNLDCFSKDVKFKRNFEASLSRSKP